MAKTLLGVIDVCGLPFRVFEADVETAPKLENNYGCCDPFKQEIWIREGLGNEARVNTLWHEVLHAIFAHSGAQEASGIDSAGEETLLQILVPHQIRAMRSASVLMQPKKKARK